MDKPKPEIVTLEEWQQARDELRAAEKEATRAADALSARRRRLPMVKFGNRYTFDTPDGTKSLLDLFDGRDQLVVYQFMDDGPDHYCPGCTWFTDNIPANAPRLLADQGVTWVTVSNMPLAQIEQYKEKMGWTMPFVSSRGTSFSADCDAGNGFMLTVFLRDGDDVYRTYSTTARGIEKLVFSTGVFDLTVYGRREDWEDSPAGWPQKPTYANPVPMQWGQASTGFGTHR
ncbi:DUF899 domain-containing protein [Actinacidiphila acididurans]|uniref:DUF899 domain-containing protein n=1 Tax=Actinacidiphila acididurans TaxID=2784346 RepID=A0ABS2TIM0_9ACTN|nr:DUF899 family protein [Actinacidiphila acididurans]MBM9503194.1 DUF899 domain-containing protein [Actinacidiphila acididurans]